MHAVENCDDEECTDEAIFMIMHAASTKSEVKNGRASLFVSGKINSIPVNWMLIDSGAVCSIISKKFWDYCKTKNPKLELEKSDAGFSAANGSSLSVIGRATLTVNLAGLSVNISFMLCPM